MAIDYFKIFRKWFLLHESYYDERLKSKYPLNTYIQFTWEYWYGHEQNRLQKVIRSEDNLKNYYQIFIEWLKSSNIETRGAFRLRDLIQTYSILLPHLLATSEERQRAVSEKHLDLRKEITLLKKGYRQFSKAIGVDHSAIEQDTFPGPGPIVLGVHRMLRDRIGEFESESQVKIHEARKRDKYLLGIYIYYFDEIISVSVSKKKQRARLYYELFRQLDVDGYMYVDQPNANNSLSGTMIQRQYNAKVTTIEKTILKTKYYKEIADPYS
jgi:hypothetical protein